MGLFSWLFKPKFEPDLIDLKEYTADLLEDRDRGGTLRPVWPEPHRSDRNWTREETEAMRRNRRVAQEIYDRIANGRQ